MFGIHDIMLFVISGFLLNLTPGPDSLLIMSKSASQGWRAGCVAVWGICSGVMVHVLAAALGLSAILASSATAFLVIKLIGAAYLIYLGISTIMAKIHGDTQTGAVVDIPRQSLRSIFMQGFLSNALNPKVALFFLAFVPQFISQDSPDKGLAFLLLGTLFNINSLIYCHLLVAFSVFASKRIKLSQVFRSVLNKSIGGVFVAVGVKLALFSNE